MRPEIGAVVDFARFDRVSGASWLTVNVCKSLMQLQVAGRLRMDGDEVAEFATMLVDAQPNMGSVWNLANGILGTGGEPDAISKLCESFILHHSTASSRIAVNVAHLLRDKTVITNSSSRAVFHAVLKAAEDSDVKVIVCESRPMREGALMARELGNLGVETVVIADAALANRAQSADIAIVGADTVNSKGVIGKIGLLHLAMSAASNELMMPVLADTTKFAPVELVEDLRSPDEILDGNYSGVAVENFYFEQIGFGQLSFLVTENGKVMPKEAVQAVQRLSVHEVLANRRSRPIPPS